MGFHRTPTPSLDPPEPRVHPDDVRGVCPHCEGIVADADSRTLYREEWFHSDCWRVCKEDYTDAE